MQHGLLPISYCLGQIKINFALLGRIIDLIHVDAVLMVVFQLQERKFEILNFVLRSQCQQSVPWIIIVDRGDTGHDYLH